MQASRFLQVNQMQRLAARGRKLKGRGDRGRMSKMRASKAASASDRRARSAYKLMEIDDKERILWPGAVVVEFGAAPGGWTEVAVERTSLNQQQRVFGDENAHEQEQEQEQEQVQDEQQTIVHVVAFDETRMLPVPGAQCFELRVDMDSVDEVVERVYEATGQRHADVVLSDMAPKLCGDASLDHERQVMLATLAFQLSQRLLKPNDARSAFLAKVSSGSDDVEFRQMLRDTFARVKSIKPPASRKQSREYYLMAKHFQGN